MTATLEQALVEHPMLVKLPPAGKLSARQIEVLTLVACGKSTKEIADYLGISGYTVNVHRTMIYQALDIHDVASLTLYAVREGWVKAC